MHTYNFEGCKFLIEKRLRQTDFINAESLKKRYKMFSEMMDLMKILNIPTPRSKKEYYANVQDKRYPCDQVGHRFSL